MVQPAGGGARDPMVAGGGHRHGEAAAERGEGQGAQRRRSTAHPRSTATTKKAAGAEEGGGVARVDGVGGVPAVGELGEGVDGVDGGAAKPEKATPRRETVPASGEGRPEVVGDGGERGRRRELVSGGETARQRVETGEGGSFWDVTPRWIPKDLTATQRRRLQRLRAQEIREKKAEEQRDKRFNELRPPPVWRRKTIEKEKPVVVEKKEEQLVAKDESSPKEDMDINMVCMLPMEFFAMDEAEVAHFSLGPKDAVFEKPDESNRHMKPLYLKGHIDGKPVSRMLVDGGATVNLMPYSLFKKLGHGDDELKKTNMILNGFNGEPTEAKGIFSAELTVGNKTLPTAFFIVDVQETNLEWLQKRVQEYRSTKNDIGETIEDFDEVEKLGQGFISADPLEEVDIGDGTKPRLTFVNKNMRVDYKVKIIELLKEYVDCFAWEYHEMPGLSPNLRLAFERMRRYGLKMNPLKCAFGVSAGKFLGFMVHERGVEINPKKIEKIRDFKAPTCKKEVQKLLGKIDAFVPILLLKKEADFTWEPKQQEAFEELKRYLSTLPVVRAPKAGKPFRLYIASEDKVIGAVLTQEEDGKEYIITYLSRRLLDVETRPILSGRIGKRAYALIEYYLAYEPLKSMKGQIETEEDWRIHLIRYLKDPTLKVDRKIRRQAFKYTLLDEDLYRRNIDGVLLKCLDEDQSKVAMGEGHRFVLVATDYFTKWAEAVPLKNTTHTEANGQAESSNKTLLKLVKKKIEEHPKRWHEVLSEPFWAHRISKYGATKVTPFELVYGQEAILPVKTLMGDNLDEVIDKRLKALEEIEKEKRVAKAYNKRVKAKLFQVGDLVWKTILPLVTRSREFDEQQKQTKYKDAPPTAIDLFKECHCKSKMGFNEPVKNVIAVIEVIIDNPAQEGQDMIGLCRYGYGGTVVLLTD
uniref:Retrotransposon protein, putative, unclassified n=1 Tax=Oryza sativa subsp. japonica TaxID=39947 RepID=Q2QS80_ORYSJ|nr:retrotransposon protein, putative, unclassified [Oryza sativa Japonica Group]